LGQGHLAPPPPVGAARPDAYDCSVETDPAHPSFYWTAPEDDLPQTRPHGLAVCWTVNGIEEELRERNSPWWVADDLPAAWDPQDQSAVRAPDILVREPPAPGDRTAYRQGIPGKLRFVAEYGSRSSARRDGTTKREDYGLGLQPDEYLYYNPADDTVALYVWDGRQYVPVGVVQIGVGSEVSSQVLDMGFRVTAPGELRVVNRAGQLVEVVAEAKERASQEAEQRREEAARADREAARRAAAERLAAEQEEQLTELQRQLDELRRQAGLGNREGEG